MEYGQKATGLDQNSPEDAEKGQCADGAPVVPPSGLSRYPSSPPNREAYRVHFESESDPDHPQNWLLSTKLGISSILVLNTLAATFSSAVFSPAQSYIGEEFGKGTQVLTLGTSLFVVGYALGPIVFAPLSELYGRRPPVIVAAVAFGIFNIGSAVAKDYQTLMICRFFAGVFGSCPVTVVAAVFADIFSHKWRGLAILMFSASTICGPLTGPLIGGFIAKSHLGWRWTSYLPAIVGFVAAFLSMLFQKESYPPVVLVEKARKLRRLTGNWCIHAEQELIEVNIKSLATQYISRPLRILFTEPIVFLITLYTSFLYGLLYLSLAAYALIFGRVHGFSPGIDGLPYLAMILGVFLSAFFSIYTNKFYVKKLEANNNVPVPEWRLPIVIFSGPIVAGGLFWLGWGGYNPRTHWIVPTIAGLPLGFGVFSIFLPCLNYIIDAYLLYAASAIAANTVLRSISGAVFPHIALYLFDGIGIHWGMTVLGSIAVLFVPVPLVFYYKGKQIRARSKFPLVSNL
ncbi:hypothetical protein CDD83_11063 [Cordyceps sp. RAO-2017]|nr:hypothetical protein CDD83_11063 [Cordyceps sp. RAO-2017]